MMNFYELTDWNKTDDDNIYAIILQIFDFSIFVLVNPRSIFLSSLRTLRIYTHTLKYVLLNFNIKIQTINSNISTPNFYLQKNKIDLFSTIDNREV